MCIPTVTLNTKMKENLSNYISSEEQLGIIRTKRDLPPAHYTFKIQSFSKLVDLKMDYVESSDFEVDSYKWKLLFYPNGNKKTSTEGHVSMYLVFSESNKLSDGWEVHVNYKFLVYNQLQDKYFTIEDGGGRTKRFYKRKTKWGIDKLLFLEFFKEPSNGCLVEDCCILGADISVIKSNGCGESLSFTELVANNTFTWKVDNFPTLTLESYTSKVFVMGDQKWKLIIYPKGDGKEKDKSLSLFLEIQGGPTLESGKKVYAEYILKMKDQIQDEYLEKPVIAHHFTSTNDDWGYPGFLPLTELNLASEGYIKDNALVIEVEFKVVSKVQDLP